MNFVLITGSTNGIGLQIAKDLIQEGRQVIFTGRNQSALKDLHALHGDVHRYLQVDFMDDKSFENFLGQLGNFPIEAVVHNLGGKVKGDVHPVDLDVLMQSIHLNIGVSIKINNFLEEKLHNGKIIYIDSSASLHAKASPCYTLSKSMIATYIKNIAGCYLEKGIFICGIIPGIILHQGSDWDQKRITEPEKFDKVQKAQPLGRFLEPKDVSEHIIHLLSLKSCALTGSTIKLDANEY